MFAFRERVGGVEVGFTDRHGLAGSALNLSLVREGRPVAGPEPGDSLQLVADAFGDGALPVGLHQVHGGDVFVLDETSDAGPGREVEADAIVTRLPGRTLLVRAADCAPVVLADTEARVVAAAHCGRPGLLADVVPHTVAVMRELGARDILAWVGPTVCGSCYEVPEELRAEVSAHVPQAWATTSWGTPALDIPAGVLAQLAASGATARRVDRCTREDDDLWSHRRDGAAAGRLGGLVRVLA